MHRPHSSTRFAIWRAASCKLAPTRAWHWALWCRRSGCLIRSVPALVRIAFTSHQAVFAETISGIQARLDTANVFDRDGALAPLVAKQLTGLLMCAMQQCLFWFRAAN